MRARQQKAVTGYVVKRETIEEKEDPKRAGNVLKFKVRREVSRVYHSVDAAKTFLDLIKKDQPGDYYVHEKRKSVTGAIE
jgi:hypothetical protein